MPKEFKAGCQKPKLEKEPELEQSNDDNDLSSQKEETNMLKVGQAAPDFTASAFYDGKFVSLKLSEYLGKWVLLCFYPGDFTFV